MIKKIFYLILIFMVSLAGCKKTEEESVQIEVIEGIPHVMNHDLPLKGTVLLELGKQLEINPYEREEIGLRSFDAVKDMDGEVILFDVNNSEAERFTKDGNYIGSLFRKGQGPGEFTRMSLLYVRFMNSQIWVTGRQKLAKFDKQGQLVEEFRLGDSIITFIDQNLYVTEKRTRTGKDLHKQIMIKKISETNEIEEGPVLMEGTNLSFIQIPPNTGFGDEWGTPDIEYAVDRDTKKIYVAMKTEYKIQANDTEGNTLYVIEASHKHVTLSGKDKEIMLEIMLQYESDRKQKFIDAYPDKLMAIKEMKVLPGGYLAVYRISGLKKYEIDVFDDLGRYIYRLQFPENINLDKAVFYDFGFATVETVDDFPVYIEYRIKNLPEIFSIR
jgi:hypothetical protein